MLHGQAASQRRAAAASHAEITADKRAYCRAFLLEYQEQDPVRGHALCQQQDAQRYLVQNPPALPLTRQELDRVYDLPFTRLAHPMYDAQGGVPALQEVRFSISAVRGCFGACSFCALTFHQGRIVSSRSEESLLKEARLLASFPDFKATSTMWAALRPISASPPATASFGKAPVKPAMPLPTPVSICA